MDPRSYDPDFCSRHLVDLPIDVRIACVESSTGGSPLERSLARLTIALIAVRASALPAAAAAGDLDESFGGDGKVRIGFGAPASAQGAVVLADGRIVVAGTVEGAFAVLQLRPDGGLDSKFTGDGLKRIEFDERSHAEALAIDPDGRIVVAGAVQESPAGGERFALARLLPSGRLDSSFGGDGRVVTNFRGGAGAYDVAIGGDGRIVAVGEGGSDFALAAYMPDGSPDQAFAGDGKRLVDLGGEDFARGTVIQGNGRIVAAGSVLDPLSETQDFGVVRLMPDGSFDGSFGDAGKVTTDFRGASDLAQDVALQSDGKIVVTGWTSLLFRRFATVRYSVDGTLDRTFGGNGRVATLVGNHASGAALSVAKDGKILVAGTVWWSDTTFLDPRSDFAVVRYKPDGALDRRFGEDGRVTTDFRREDSGNAISPAPQGRIIVAGTASGEKGVYLALARYDAG